MALRIGRSKPASNDTPPLPVSPAPHDAVAHDTVFDAAPIADQSTLVAAPRKKPPLALIGLGLFGLVGASLAAYHFLGPKAEDTDDTAMPVIARPRPPKVVAAAPKDLTPTSGVAVKGASGKKRPIVVNPRLAPAPKNGAKVVRRVTGSPTPQAPVLAAIKGRVADTGTVPANAPKTSAFIKPAKKGGLPRSVPARGVPTPIQAPDGLAGLPGKRADRNEVVIVRRITDTPLTPALQTRLDRLWQQGADAKHKGNFGAARRAWQEILQLHPAHPGVQEAINKLPRS